MLKPPNSKLAGAETCMPSGQGGGDEGKGEKRRKEKGEEGRERKEVEGRKRKDKRKKTELGPQCTAVPRMEAGHESITYQGSHLIS